MTRPGASPFRPPSTGPLPGSSAFRSSGCSVGSGPLGVGAPREVAGPALSAGSSAVQSAVTFWAGASSGPDVRKAMAELVGRLNGERGFDPRKTTGDAASRFGIPFSGALVELRCSVSSLALDARFALGEIAPFRVLHVADAREPTGFEAPGESAELRGTSELQRILETSQEEDWLYPYEERLCHRYWFLVTMETLVEDPQSIGEWRLLACQTRDLSGPSPLERTWTFLRSTAR